MIILQIPRALKLEVYEEAIPLVQKTYQSMVYINIMYTIVNKVIVSASQSEPTQIDVSQCTD